MKYTITKTYDCKPTTCGELAKKLKEFNGRKDCILSEFIDLDNPDLVERTSENWAWIEDQSKYKILYILEMIDVKCETTDD